MTAKAFVLITLASFIRLSSENDRELTSVVYGENYVPINSSIRYTGHKVNVPNKVRVDLYYECFCPFCRNFDTGVFKEALQKFGNLLEVQTYPFGNAEIIKQRNGRIYFKCQHGPGECYGNKLHCCALDKIPNKNQALLFNSCMMENIQSNKGSDDLAADRCAYNMNIDPEPIKSCAKGSRGTELLKFYGEESKKANFSYVPYILVNGHESSAESFIQDICNSFKNTPPSCSNIFVLESFIKPLPRYIVYLH